ncbi:MULTISPECIES: MOFRL family protein [unclassified Paraburkholderia]|jgi:hydroxypyruvate reductase|uniref:MOFRL family protein n=1 Tax=unclassified Paraburkholderia TaxID=2615204 RepID=UPI0038B96227
MRAHDRSGSRAGSTLPDALKTMKRARERGIRASERLDNNDAHGFFQALGDSAVTGPTLTSVNDFVPSSSPRSTANFPGADKDAPHS